MNQRAIIAAKLANMKEGRPWPDNSKNFDGCNVSASQAADLMLVSRPQVFHAT